MANTYTYICYIHYRPGKTRLDDAYKDAHAAGLASVDCLQLFHDCPRGESVLDSLAVDVHS